MPVLVTGSEGFIGTHLCRKLDDLGEIIHRIDVALGTDILTYPLPDNIDRVFHLAAQTDAYCANTWLDAETNILGSIRIFEKYRTKVVFASSSMVNYPVNPYAISKRACEDYARMYGCAVVRFCNIYGPGGHSFIEKCEAAETITIYGTGEQKRTWQRVAVAVDALIAVKPGECTILDGDDWIINEIAARYAKPRIYRAARAGDLLDATQL